MRNILSSIYREVKNRMFYIKNRKFINDFFQGHGYHKTRPFNLNNWHHNLYLFTAFDKKGEAVFIKFTNLPRILKNENRAYKKLKKDLFLKEHIIDHKGYIKKEGFKALILKRANGTVLNEEWALNNSAELHTLIKIVDRFTALSLVHRDIKLDNFIYEEDRIKIFDFSFMIDRSTDKKLKEIDLSINENISKLMTMGTGYKPESLKWDDYYALYVIFDKLLKNMSNNISLEKKATLVQHIDECKSKIGTNSYSISK